jgi:hypothetical protein
MSGGTKVKNVVFPEDLLHSTLFVVPPCDRFWCETGAVIAPWLVISRCSWPIVSAMILRPTGGFRKRM